MDTNYQPAPKRGPRGKYRQHSQEFKRKVVELAMQPGASVPRVARDHGVNANQVFTWRRQHAAGQLAGGCAVEPSEFLPVVVTPSPTPSLAAPEQLGIITLEWQSAAVHRRPSRSRDTGAGIGPGVAMIGLPAGNKVWLVAGTTDMRSGFNGLAAKVQTALKEDPLSGHVFVFRGRRSDLIKLLWWTGDGL